MTKYHGHFISLIHLCPVDYSTVIKWICPFVNLGSQLILSLFLLRRNTLSYYISDAIFSILTAMEIVFSLGKIFLSDEEIIPFELCNAQTRQNAGQMAKRYTTNYIIFRRQKSPKGPI